MAVRLYAGATNASGHPYIIGGPLPGPELRWALPATEGGTSMRQGIADSAIAYIIPRDVNEKAADLNHFHFDDASCAEISELAPLCNAENTDLRPFHKHGSRLILWHGLTDQSIFPRRSWRGRKLVLRLPPFAPRELRRVMGLWGQPLVGMASHRQVGRFIWLLYAQPALCAAQCHCDGKPSGLSVPVYCPVCRGNRRARGAKLSPLEITCVPADGICKACHAADWAG